jgi:hypothetical protein
MLLPGVTLPGPQLAVALVVEGVAHGLRHQRVRNRPADVGIAVQQQEVRPAAGPAEDLDVGVALERDHLVGRQIGREVDVARHQRHPLGGRLGDVDDDHPVEEGLLAPVVGLRTSVVRSWGDQLSST